MRASGGPNAFDGSLDGATNANSETARGRKTSNDNNCTGNDKDRQRSLLLVMVAKNLLFADPQ